MKLKERINKAGIRHKKIAEKLCVSETQLSFWLNGTRQMPHKVEQQVTKIIEKAEKALN